MTYSPVTVSLLSVEVWKTQRACSPSESRMTCSPATPPLCLTAVAQPGGRTTQLLKAAAQPAAGCASQGHEFPHRPQAQHHPTPAVWLGSKRSSAHGPHNPR
eukprot:365119-Chlamydomonas_euryale.AAC.10